MAHLNLPSISHQNDNRKSSFYSNRSSILTGWAKSIVHEKLIELHSSFSENSSQSESSESTIFQTPKDLLRSKTLEKKSLKAEKLYKSLKILDTLIIILSISSLFLEIYNFEYNSQDTLNHRYKDPNLNDYIKVTNFSITGFVIFMAYFRSVYSFKLSRELKFIFEDPIRGYYFSSSFKIFLIDVGILICVPPPYFDFEMEFEQLDGKLNLNFASICLTLMMFRLILLFRLFLYYSKWADLAVRNQCRKLGVYRPLVFALKACLNDRPHFLLIPAFAISTLALGVALQIYEKPFNENNALYADNGSTQDYGFLYNSMWLILLTMTTVGFGDTFPRTHMGRIITIITIIWGTFLLSLMIIMFNNYILFSRNQEKSFYFLSKIHGSLRIKKYASKIISKFIILYVYNKKRRISFKDPSLIKLYKQLMHYRCLFKETIYNVKVRHPTFRDALASMEDEINFNLTKLEKIVEQSKDLQVQLDNILESQKKTMEYIKFSTRFSNEALQIIRYSRSII